MNAKEQIKRDLTNYANSKNLDIKVAIENILSVAPTATLEEYHEYPERRLRDRDRHAGCSHAGLHCHGCI